MQHFSIMKSLQALQQLVHETADQVNCDWMLGSNYVAQVRVHQFLHDEQLVETAVLPGVHLKHINQLDYLGIINYKMYILLIAKVP